MPPVEQSIVLSAIGGDQAAGEIAKTSNALNGVTETSKGMESAFSHRFTHIGLMLFGQQLLQTSGLASETRQIIGVLQTSLFAVASSFGAASGPILLVGSGLVALIAIMTRVNEKHQESFENIQKEIDSRQKEVDSLDKTVSALDHYAASGGHLTDAQKQLMAASQDMTNVLKNQQIAALQSSIEVLETNRQKIIDHAQTMAAWHEYVADATIVWNFLVDRIKEALSPLSAVTGFVSKLAHGAEGFLGFGQSVKASGQDLTTMNAALAQNAQLLAQKKADLEALRNGFDKMGVAAVEAQQKELDGFKKVNKEMQDEIDAEHAHERASMDSLISANIKARQQEDKETTQIVKHISDQIGSDFGNAFAKMIVEGKSFTDQMKQAFTNMAEQIISDLMRIVIEQQLLFMWQTMTGTQGSGNISGGGGGGGGIFAGLFATGGTVIADTPTLAVFGEAGPEMATFTPLSAGAPSGGGGGVSIGSVVTNISGVQNPEAIANEVGRRIIQQIRGAGQMDFVR